LTFALFIVIAAAAFWALLGLGETCCRAIGYRAGSRAETVGIGLAGLICAGGILNLCRVSYGPVYDCLLLAGVIAAFRGVLFTSAGAFSRCRTGYPVSAALLALGVIWLVGHAELPPTAFNYHDDFEKYFVHPLRMLQTGTLFGSPLSTIGTESLGGQAVLQAIVVRHFPLPYLFAVDSLFALLLCILLILAVIPVHPWRIPLLLLSVVTLTVIDPLRINVSSIYTTCALLMTLLTVCRSLYLGEAECLKPATLPLLLGMLLAGLLALKSINAVYLLTVFTAAAVVQVTGRGRSGSEPEQGMRLVATAGATALFIMPWVLVHAPHYLASGSATIDGTRFAVTEPPYQETLELLSFKPLFYGSSYAHYSLLMLAVVFYCLAFYYLSDRLAADRRAVRGWLFACGAALPVSALLILGLGPQLNGYFANIRYTAPLLIAGSAIFLPIAVSEAWRQEGRRAALWMTAIAMCGVSLAALFSGGFGSRLRQAARFGNSLAFSGLATDREYLAYNSEVLYGRTAGQMRRIQGTIPVGATVLAWVTAPFHLDFSRNRIYDVEQAGVANPWAHLPGVDYVMYQYAGYAVPSLEVIYEDLRHPGRRERQVGRNALAVIDELEQLRSRSQELYDDGETVVFKVAAAGEHK